MVRTYRSPRAARRANPLHAIAYLRVSTGEQHLGPEAQRASITAWAAREGITIVAWFIDKDVSGAAPIDERPALVEALASLVEHRAGVLVVAKRDRLARDPVAGALIERAVRDAGAKVVSCAGEGSDGDDPSSILMRRIVDAFAEHERLVIAVRTKAALAVKKARGERVGSVPFGWRVDADGVRLLPVQVEQDAIAVAKDLRGRGASLNEIADALAGLGMLSRAGRRFHHEQVARMLSDR